MKSSSQKRITYTTTAKTFDEDAIKINSLLNDVDRMVKIGHMLKDILLKHFNGAEKEFKRWCRHNIDKDAKSVMRYICLADNETLLTESGLIRLSEAYEVLGIDGNAKE